MWVVEASELIERGVRLLLISNYYYNYIDRVERVSYFIIY